MNINGNLIRPETLAQMAAEIGMDFATHNMETGGMDFHSEAAAAAWHEVYDALAQLVGTDKADQMITEAEYRA